MANIITWLVLAGSLILLGYWASVTLVFDHTFYASFWPGLLSTLIGIILGIPIAFNLNRLSMRHAEKAQEEEGKKRLNRGLQVLRESLETNHNRFPFVLEALKDRKHLLLDLGLNAVAWDTTQSEIIPYLDNPKLKDYLAFYFDQVAAFSRLYERFLDQAIGVNAMIGENEELLEGVRQACLVKAETLEEATTKLVEILDARLELTAIPD